MANEIIGASGPMGRSNSSAFALALSLAAGMACLGAPAGAQVLGTCLGAQGGSSCAANDVTIASIAVTAIKDGCVDTTGDTATVDLTATIQSGAPDRYDIGLWFATQGTSALTGSECLHDFLPVAEGFEDREDDPLNLPGVDICGDVGNNQTYTRDIIDISVPCKDLDGNGDLDFGTCTSWKNQEDEEDCDGVQDTLPSTGSKCNCEDSVQSGVSAPNLTLTKDCTPDTVEPGGMIHCVITVANTGLGTAESIHFEDDYPQDYGTVSALTPSAGTATDDGDIVTWDPGDIPPGASVTLDYDFSVFGVDDLPSGSANDTFTNVVSTFWTDSLGTPILQPSLTASETTTVPVELSSFQSIWNPRTMSLELRWATATEAANLGFNLYGVERGKLVKLNDQLVPSKVGDSTRRTTYSFRWKGRRFDAFAVEAIDFRGKPEWHGPFALGERRGNESRRSEIDWRRIRSQRNARTAVAAGRSLHASEVERIVLEVDADGIYRIGYEEIRLEGLDLAGVPASEISLTHRGRPIPLRVDTASGSDSFGPGAFIEFVGTAESSLYTGARAYVLERDPSTARRPLTLDATPLPGGTVIDVYRHTLEATTNKLYSFSSPGSDPWYDRRMLALASEVQHDVEATVTELADGGGALDLAVWGGTDFPEAPDHRLIVELNGVEIADESFDGLTLQEFELPLAPGLLREGANTITLRLPHDTGADYDLVLLDRAAVTFPRRLSAVNGQLDFRTAGGTVRASGFGSSDVVVYRQTGQDLERLVNAEITSEPDGYAVSFEAPEGSARYFMADVTAIDLPGARTAAEFVPSNRPAEYLIITHGDFLGRSLDRLARYRQRGGLSVDIVQVDGLYARDGGHLPDAEPIRAYIRESVELRGTRFVLLVGGDTYDYKDYLGLGSISFIPSLYRQTDEIVRFAPVDAAYADVDGDDIPDIALGRLPVRTADELAAAIDKIMDYDGKSYSQTALMVADRDDLTSGRSFAGDNEALTRDLVDDGWVVERAYLDNPLGGDLDWVRARIQQTINEGVLADSRDLDSRTGGVALVWFSGHSGPSTWSFDGIFTGDDAAGLVNDRAPSFIAQWGCWNTYYVSPTENSLGHRLMLNPTGGAAGVLGASTLTDAGAERQLAELLSERLREPGTTLGEAVLDAKREYATHAPEQLDVLLGLTLLGDPAQRLLD